MKVRERGRGLVARIEKFTGSGGMAMSEFVDLNHTSESIILESMVLECMI